MDTTTWTCPNNPFHHDWNGGLACRSCSATRTATDAITSLLAGYEGWDTKRAATLVDQHRAEVLGQHADFFQPGRTYQHKQWTFRCDAVTTHPGTGELTAVGWFRFLDTQWQLVPFEGPVWADGWTDITGELA